jgi:hypothetical protein
MPQARKWQGMRSWILTIHRTKTTRRADFAVHFTRRAADQRCHFYFVDQHSNFDSKQASNSK